MPFEDFDAARRAYAAEHGELTVEPVQFALCGETFTALREAMWGDVLQLWDAPELEDDEARATLSLQKFIRAMIDPDDRVRFDAAMFRLPHSQAGITMLGVASYITQHMTGFPTMPPNSSVSTQPSTGESSSASLGGDTTSSNSPRSSDAASRTGTSPGTAIPNRSGRSTDD